MPAFTGSGCLVPEVHQFHTGKNDQLMPLPWLEGILVIIGYSAIFINLFYLLIWGILYLFKKQNLFLVDEWYSTALFFYYKCIFIFF
jgi:hypothetical protein